jgi:hypothetical protein
MFNLKKGIHPNNRDRSGGDEGSEILTADVLTSAVT